MKYSSSRYTAKALELIAHNLRTKPSTGLRSKPKPINSNIWEIILPTFLVI